MLDLSIIIVNYNVKEFLQNLIYSIEKAGKNISYEVIVVDNASDDGSIEMLRSKFPDIQLIANTGNAGFSKANNQGLKVAKGDFLLLLNPDTLVQEDTFETLINFLKNNDDAGMAGCKVLNPDGTLQLACRRSFPGPWTSFSKVTGLSAIFPKSKFFARYNLTYLDENDTYEVDAISGSFMMLKREVYEKIGGLDEIFFMYGEDLDWCYRVQKAGYKVYYVHSTQIIHYKGESTKRSTFNETKVFYSAMHIFVKKHFSKSFLILFFLRFAILIRGILAFAGKYKIVVLSILLDIFFYNVIIIAAEAIYRQLQIVTWHGFPDYAYPVIFIVPVLIHILTAVFIGVYEKNNFAIIKNTGSIIVSFFLLSAVTYFTKEYAFSRGILLLIYIILLVVLNGWRLLFKFVFRIGLSSYDSSRRRTLVVGSGKTAEKIAEKIQRKYTSYHSVIGFIGLSRLEIGSTIGKYKVIGSLETVDKIIRQEDINEVIFATDDLKYYEMMGVVSSAAGENVEFRMAGDNLDFIIGKSAVSLLDDMPMVELTYNITQTKHRFVKRVLDLILSVLILFFIYPFIFCIDKLSKRTSGFREAILKTPSVLAGTMSFVGPRIHQKDRPVFLGKPGITGLWYTESEQDEQAEKLDMFYAKNQSIWLDLEILGKTFVNFFMKRK